MEGHGQIVDWASSMEAQCCNYLYLKGRKMRRKSIYINRQMLSSVLHFYWSKLNIYLGKHGQYIMCCNSKDIAHVNKGSMYGIFGKHYISVR